jgi:plasmid stability protein
MPAKTLTVAIPEALLKQLRGRARRAKRTVEAEVLKLLSDAVLGGNGSPTNGTGHHRNGRPTTVVGKEEDELSPDIKAAIAEVGQLDEAGLRKAVVPLMKPKQAKRLADLNSKAQAKVTGLTDAEEAERDELLHLYEKSMVVRASALAELHKLGVDVSEFIRP